MSRSSLRHEGEALGSGHEHVESDWGPVALWKKVCDSSLSSLLPSPGGPWCEYSDTRPATALAGTVNGLLPWVFIPLLFLGTCC